MDIRTVMANGGQFATTHDIIGTPLYTSSNFLFTRQDTYIIIYDRKCHKVADINIDADIYNATDDGRNIYIHIFNNAVNKTELIVIDNWKQQLVVKPIIGDFMAMRLIGSNLHCIERRNGKYFLVILDQQLVAHQITELAPIVDGVNIYIAYDGTLILQDIFQGGSTVINYDVAAKKCSVYQHQANLNAYPIGEYIPGIYLSYVYDNSEHGSLDGLYLHSLGKIYRTLPIPTNMMGDIQVYCWRDNIAVYNNQVMYMVR